MIKRGIKAERLDGDALRKVFSYDLGFSKHDRERNIERVTFIAKLLSRNGIAVIASFISPYRSMRKRVRKEVTNFIEVFVNTPLKICEKRDKQGLYKKAREGKIKNFTGISDIYEKSENPEIELHTEANSIKKNVDIIINYLKNHGYLK